MLSRVTGPAIAPLRAPGTMGPCHELWPLRGGSWEL